jgi:hypothetical protein
LISRSKVVTKAPRVDRDGLCLTEKPSCFFHLGAAKQNPEAAFSKTMVISRLKKIVARELRIYLSSRGLG